MRHHRHRGHALKHRYGRAKLTYVEKTHMPRSAFALPHRRQLPLETPGEVRSSAAALSRMHRQHHVTPAEYREGLRHLRAAARHHGVDLEM